MVIRFTKATRFFCICALLLVTALVSIGTRSVSVAAPYKPGEALPVVIYRAGIPTSPSAQEIRGDLSALGGFTPLSEQDLVAALRHALPLPARPVLLLFDDDDPGFAEGLRPLLDESGLPWLPLSKAALLSKELRAAGYPVLQLERVSGFALQELLDIKA